MENMPEKKNNTTRNILIGVGVLAALCLCVAVIGYFGMQYVGTQVTALGTQMVEVVKTDPAEIAQVAAGIVDFDMPPGYQYEMGMSMFGYDTVALAPSDLSNGYVQIMLVQMPKSSGASQEELQAQAEQAMSRPSVQDGASVVVGTRTETIRGQQVIITITESSGGGYATRQWMAFFDSKGGQVVMMIQGATAGWDDELFLDFIHSIR